MGGKDVWKSVSEASSYLLSQFFKQNFAWEDVRRAKASPLLGCFSSVL